MKENVLATAVAPADGDLLATAVALADGDLLARIPVLAAHERAATAELVAHLAALRLRPSLYAAQGYGSLFAYCRDALRLSEDAAANRIHAVRACLRYPVILDLLASGELSLSAVRMLRRHLTLENHERVLARARNARRSDIERLVAELAPRPDVPSSVRKLPRPGSSDPAVGPTSALGADSTEGSIGTGDGTGPPPGDARGCLPDLEPAGPCPAAEDLARGYPGEVDAAHPHRAGSERREGACPAECDVVRPRAKSVHRPVVQPLSPERYRVQFTVGQDAYDILRRLQTLLRREIPDGDAGAICERALRLLYREVEADKFGRASKGKVAPKVEAQSSNGQERSPKSLVHDGAPEGLDRVTQAPAIASLPAGAYEDRIRPGADPARARSRYIQKAVKRAVWYRDRGQCAFVSASGQRCVEREFLELHHIQPYALNGPPTAANIALRCRRHNLYEAEVVFGGRGNAARANVTSDRVSRELEVERHCTNGHGGP